MYNYLCSKFAFNFMLTSQAIGLLINSFFLIQLTLASECTYMTHNRKASLAGSSFVCSFYYDILSSACTVYTRSHFLCYLVGVT